MTNRILAYIAATSALLMSCSSHSELEEVKDITQSHEPIRFRNNNDNYQVSRASNPLTQNFLVSTYKSFGSNKQQTVMNMYEVNYESYSSAYGTVNWNYISGEGENHTFYQTQIERYWDFGAFPYRFFAVSPAPIQEGALTQDFSLTDQQLTIPMAYKYQTCTNGTTTTGAEPCLVAEVERNQAGHDFDLLVKADNSTDPVEINNTSTTLNRIVALPFHHLNCKVRFGIYCPEIGEGEEHEVKNVTIKASSSSSDFVTSAKYNASLSTSSSMMDGTFTPASTSDVVTLVRVEPEATQHGNELYHGPETDEKAAIYWFECQNGLMQVPQENVKLSITFSVKGKFEDPDIESISLFDGEYTTFTDLPIVIKNPAQDTYTWEKNKYYTYYIILGKFTTTIPQFPIVDGDADIWFTCVEEPWEDVVGSMDTSLED